MKTYYIESLGCAKNLVDSEICASIMHRAGLDAVEVPEDADLVLVNTCAFLVESLKELDLVLADLAALKNARQIEKLVVTGCVMNRAQEEFRDIYPEVDEWFGLKDFSALENWLGLEQATEHERSPITQTYHRYLRISDGCSNHCSYCTIPSIRGDMRSIPMEDLVREAEALAADEDNPAIELVVIAQDTANYGMDIYGSQALPELLEKLHAIPQFRWIRVMYMQPDHFKLEWLALWKKLPKLLPYFEIPIQHSEDAILKAMNRKAGRKQLEALFTTIRKEIPNAVLRTTLISGLPGETRADALAMQDFIKRYPFLHLGVFLFSPEEGTPALDMPNQVPVRTAERRRDRMLTIQNTSVRELLEQYVGKNIDVLIEDRASEDEDDVYVGRAWFQAPEIDGFTFVQGKDLQLGTIYKVLITDTIDVDLFGDAITD
jgi:ribosomal protein S12 methylthiotransferase